MRPYLADALASHIVREDSFAGARLRFEPTLERFRPGSWRSRASLGRRTLALADMLAITLAIACATLLGGGELTVANLLAAPIFVLVVKATGLYDRDEHLLHKTTLDEIPAIFGVAAVATLLVTITDAFTGDAVGQLEIVGLWSALLVAMLALRALARWVARAASPPERCVLIGDPETAEFVREKIALSHAVKAELVGVISPDARAGEHEALDEVPDDDEDPGTAHVNVDRVILASDWGGQDDLMFTIRRLTSLGVKVSLLPEASRIAGSSVELDHLHGMTLLGMRRFEFTRSSRIIKRTSDIVGSGLALIVLLPLLAVIAVAVKLDSRGPILFRQARVGGHGELFEMLKFRSMHVGADERKNDVRHLNEGASGLFKIAGDPRITRLGGLLRAYQLDELPQLFNVLVGQMSLVGPRPLIPEEDSQIEGWFRHRLDVPPGITGHWQVLGSSARIPLTEMVKLDYFYVANWSLWGDILLLLRTVPFIIRRRGL